MSSIPESVKLVGDSAAVIGWVTVLTGVLTNVVGLFAAIGSLVWVCIRIYETKTVQKWISNRRQS